MGPHRDGQDRRGHRRPPRVRPRQAVQGQQNKKVSEAVISLSLSLSLSLSIYMYLALSLSLSLFLSLYLSI